MRAKLTERERNTFLALLANPDMSDREISEKIGIKMSTVTSIRRRLRDRGYYKKVRIPNFTTLNAEILTVIYGVTRTSSYPDIKGIRRKINTIATPFYFLISPNGWMSMELFQSFNDFFVFERRLRKLQDDDVEGMLGDLNIVIFPIKHLLRDFEFTYERVIEDLMGIKIERIKKSKEYEEIEMKPTEKKVYFYLIKFPTKSDRFIGEMIKMPRQSVSKIRKKLEMSGIYYSHIIPNYSKVGIEAFALYHIKLPLNTPNSEILESIEMLYRKIPISFLVASNEDLIFEAAYDRMEKLCESSKDVYSISRHLRKIENVIIFPTKDTESVSNHNYSGFIKKVLI